MSDGVVAHKSKTAHVIGSCAGCREFDEEAWLSGIPAFRERVRRHVQKTGHTVTVINETATSYRPVR
jgi:hypothetical protein